MSATTFKELKSHLNHYVELVSYGSKPNEIYLECVDCNEVIKSWTKGKSK